MKVFITLASLLMFIVLACLYLLNSGEQEISLLPDMYQGVVVIIFESKDGEDALIENGSRIYNIPSSGILKTKFKMNKGWRPPQTFFYKKTDGSRVLLSNYPSVKVYSPQVGETHIGDKCIEFMTYIVSTPDRVSDFSKKRESILIKNI